MPCGEGFTGLGGQETAKWICKEVAYELGKVVDSREVLEGKNNHKCCRK